MNMDRRELLTRSSVLLGGLTAGVLSRSQAGFSQESLPGAESWNKDSAVRQKDDKILKIGGIFGLWSHTSSTWWRYLNQPEGYARATGMRVTHLWCVDPETGARLAKRYDAEVVSKYDDMVGRVDGMFIDDFRVTPFMPDLSLPYIEAGIPCFFDRPMASSVAGAMKVIEASKRSGTPFMVASAYEYLKEVEVALYRQKAIGEVRAYEARNSGSNIYMYALHGLWFVLKTMGVDVERIGCRATDPENGSSLTTLEHRRDGRLFYGTMHQARLKDIMCSVKAYGKEGNCEVTCTVDGRPWYKDIYTYLEMLHAMERMIRTKTAPETLDYTEAKIRIFIALLYSVYEKEGGMVEVSSLPVSWDAGFPKSSSRSYSDDIINRYRKVLKY